MFNTIFQSKSLEQPAIPFKTSTSGNLVEAFIDGKYQAVQHIWPLVNENLEFINVIAFGGKSGADLKKLKFYKKKFKKYKFIYNCQSGPFYMKKRKKLYKAFDYIFDLDSPVAKTKKSIPCNHSMIVRSLPYQDFFWQPNKIQKKYDYSMLTWGPSDTVAKRWDRGAKICKLLSEKNKRGLIITQRGKKEDLYSDELLPYIQSGLLDFRNAEYSDKGFHGLTASAYVSIFPNTLDAFPKHIIESLLADKKIIISDDLLLGSKTLSELPDNICLKINFDKTNWEQELLTYIQSCSLPNTKGSSPRNIWLDRYGFYPLTKLWAKEINIRFGTNHKHVFFMNHINRAKQHGYLPFPD